MLVSPNRKAGAGRLKGAPNCPSFWAPVPFKGFYGALILILHTLLR